MNIPYGKQLITEEDLEIVSRVLTSDFLTQGPEIATFESAFAAMTNAKYAVAVSNGTAALHLAVMAMGIKPGDKVITTPITFVASANCVKYAGGEVTFCDIDPDTYLMDLVKLKQMLESKPKGYYKGIIPVDFAGLMLDLELLRKLADEFGCWIIEDACHAPGAYFINSSGDKILAGSGNYADVSVFSFHPVKHIACGEGGMITSNIEKVNASLQLLRTHGITRNPELMLQNDGPWYYEMIELGYNYRLTDFQAALGHSQLNRLNWSLTERNRIAKDYDSYFENKGWKHQKVSDGQYHAHHLYIIEHPRRKELFNYLKANQIHPQIHYIPVHLMPYYRSQGWNLGDLPVAENYYSQCLSLPMFPSLLNEEFNYVLSTLDSFE